MGMPDDREDPEQYDWLYSSGRPRPTGPEQPPEPGEEPSPSGDPEATQAMPVASGSADPADTEATQAVAAPKSQSSPTPAGAAEADADGDQTQALPVTSDDAADSAEPTQVVDAGRQQPDGPQSFGGVYATPPPSTSSERYADQRTARPPTAPSPAPPSTRPPAKQAATPGGRRKKRNWWLRGVLIVLAAWLIFLIAVPIWTWQKISKVDAEPDGDRPSDTPGTTYLLVGSDSREGLTKEQRGELGTGQASGQRTDTIILLHVPAGDGPRLLLSIPRDSYVDVPGHGMNKVNAAYSLGGPELLVETVEKATDIRVDDYVEVGFTGFVDIVDAVGGITVCPETSIDDPKAGGLKMEKGCQEVDGHTALDYSRSRAFPLGDITRAEHQREVITAVGKKAASWKTVVLPWRYWSVNKAAGESLRIGENVGPIDLTRFAWAMSHTGGTDAKRCVVPYTSLGTQTDVGSVVTWDDAAAERLFQLVREDDTASIQCSAKGQ
jgi:LCP family protein required for cell wall assembly